MLSENLYNPLQMSCSYPDPCKYCNDTCDYTCYLVYVDPVTVITGFLLVVGCIVQYIPQMIKFCIEKHVNGVSIQTFHIAAYYNWNLVINFTMAQWPQIMSCQNDFYSCFSNLQSELNAIVGFIGFLIPTVQFIYYDYMTTKCNNNKKMYFIGILIFTTYALVTFTIVVYSGLHYSMCNQAYKTAAYVFGVIAGVCACIQYIPQIIHTWRSKLIGSFSILGQAFQVPGGAATLAVQILSNNSIATWIPTLIQMILQAFLLILFLLILSLFEPWKTLNKLAKEQNKKVVEKLKNNREDGYKNMSKSGSDVAEQL